MQKKLWTVFSSASIVWTVLQSIIENEESVENVCDFYQMFMEVLKFVIKFYGHSFIISL